MNCKALLLLAAVAALIALSSGCPKCLNPACHHGEVCVNLPKVAVYPGLLPKYLRLLRLNQLKALRKLRCPDCDKFHHLKPVDLLDIYDVKDLKDFKDSFYYDTYDLKKCGIKDFHDCSGSDETIEIRHESSEECSSSSSSSSEECSSGSSSSSEECSSGSSSSSEECSSGSSSSSEECSSGSSSSSQESSEEDIRYKVCRKCGHHKICTCGGSHEHGHKKHGYKYGRGKKYWKL